MTDFWIKDGETMLFIGDSITDCGRRAEHAPLGSGYVRMFGELATARMPERRIDYINRGIGGNTVVDLRDRWREDVLDVKPDHLSIKIGINDLHRHLRSDEGADPFQKSVIDLLPEYVSVVEEMSRRYDTLYIDLHQVFQHHLNYRDADAFCPEPVHPHPAGHMVIANALLDLFSSA